MPIYEYKCGSCEKQFEYMQSISEDPKQTCEECGGALSKLISAAAFSFKGGGWYKDLYASPKPDAKAAKDGGAASKGSSGSDSSGSGSSGGSKSDSGSSGGSKSGSGSSGGSKSGSGGS